MDVRETLEHFDQFLQPRGLLLEGSSMRVSYRARPDLPPALAPATKSLLGVGMLFASSESQLNAPIEPTLVAASSEAMDRDDLRLMSVLVTWLSLHGGFVRVKVLQELLRDQSPRVRAFWSAIANWSTPTSRWHLLAQRDALEPPTELLRTGTRFLLARHGEDPRFAASCLVVPSNVLSDRTSTVLTREALAREHRGYFWRVVAGPTARADAWFALEADPTLTATGLAASAHCTVRRARRLMEQWSIARQALPFTPL